MLLEVCPKTQVSRYFLDAFGSSLLCEHFRISRRRRRRDVTDEDDDESSDEDDSEDDSKSFYADVDVLLDLLVLLQRQ